MVHIELSKLRDTDQRLPILFLRAFRDDQVSLRNPDYSIFGKLLSLGLKRTTLDHILLEEGTAVGPVIALGNPTDKMQPYGAARGYYKDASWQQAVADHAKSAARIVICIDDTDSIWWEVDHIIKQHYAAKTLFLFLFYLQYQAGSANRAVIRSLMERLQLAGEESGADLIGNTGKVIGFFIDADNTIQCGVSSTFSREAYFLMLRWFLRSLT